MTGPWDKFTPEEAEAYKQKLADARRKRFAAYTPEERAAHNAKLKAGRDRYYASLKGGKRGRPRKHNYHTGWNPAKKSAASKANWANIPGYREKMIAAIKKAAQKRQKALRPLRDEHEWAKEHNTTKALKDELRQEQQRLYELAKSILADTGVEPEKNQTIDYYKEIINFFKPGTV